MEIYENFYIRRTTLGITFEVEIPPSESQEHQEEEEEENLRLSVIEEIILEITLQIECSHFQVEESGTRTLIKQHKSPKHPFTNHHHPIHIFTHDDQGLQQYLSLQFEIYGDAIDTKRAADCIIERWFEIRDEPEFFVCVFGSAFLLELTVKFWTVMMLYEMSSWPISDDDGMVPASDLAIEKMLKRLKREDSEEEQTCVICLDEIENVILQMPCSHMFHTLCIKRWLKRSHCCPSCRFPMPTS